MTSMYNKIHLVVRTHQLIHIIVVAAKLKSAGYATHFVGKWDIGKLNTLVRMREPYILCSNIYCMRINIYCVCINDYN